MSKPTAIDFDAPFDVQITQARAQGVTLSPAFYALQAEKRAQAFTVTGLASLDQVQRVADELARAQAEGKTLAEFQKWAKGEDWDLPKHRLETIYRNAAQTAYQAGHWRDFEEHAKDRPFLMYDAINDSRVRPSHLALDGIIKPTGDVFWKTHAAPMGHRCRCTLRSLTRAQAMEKGGVTQNAPAEGKADEGWGHKPAEWNKTLDDLKAAKIAKAHPVLGRAAKNGMLAPVTTFQEQKSVKAAAQWAVDNNLADFADYTGIKPEVANAWNRSLFEHLQEFPELRANQKFVGTCQAQNSRAIEIMTVKLRAANPHLPPNFDFSKTAKKLSGVEPITDRYAHSWPQQDVFGIAVNKKYGGDVDLFNKRLKYDLSQQFHPVGCDTIRSVVDHEMGHQLDTLLGLRVDSEVVKMYTQCKTIGMKNEVSGYADKYSGSKGIGEFIAECWGEVCNNPAPRPYARAIGDIIRARYKSKFGPKVP